MFDTVQVLSIGAAAVIDTALLLVLLERRNRQFARLPLLVMVGGAWLWHAGFFALLLLREFSGSLAWQLQWGCLTIMALGLFLMPCGMMHAAARLWRTGTAVLPKGNPWHLLAYLPLAALPPLLASIERPPAERVLEPLLGPAVAYVLWAGFVKIATAVVLLRYRRRAPDAHTRRFCGPMAGVLLVMTAVQWFALLVVWQFWPSGEPYLILLCALAPLAPILLLAYFVLRYNVMQLMLERTFVYGGIVLGAIVFHQIAFQELSAVLPERVLLPVIVVEAVALTMLIVLYAPLRERFAEALRYLLGHRAAEVRARLRRLGAELTARAGRPPPELVGWFANSLRDALDVEYVAAWLLDAAGDIRVRRGDTERLSDDPARLLHRRMQEANLVVCTPRNAPAPMTEWLRTAGASLAIVKGHQNISGLLLIGRHRSNIELSEEETNAVLLLVEQLAITADNSLLQLDRLAAERRALQNDKLSALGLLASSIAHEVKNPLSAIKTIATVLGEDLGPNSPHAESVRLILGEVDRLAVSSAAILDFARPKTNRTQNTCVGKVVLGTLQVLQHLARQQDIVIETLVEDSLPPVEADEAALREIVFNLLANSLDAAGPGGRVIVGCRRENGCVITEVRDSGPGISPEVREHLFEPFLTTKPAGTGLGLYIVGRRVSELGGEIQCASGPEGTSFLVKLRAS
jgi:signal transduction histidine kinase